MPNTITVYMYIKYTNNFFCRTIAKMMYYFNRDKAVKYYCKHSIKYRLSSTKKWKRLPPFDNTEKEIE